MININEKAEEFANGVISKIPDSLCHGVIKQSVMLGTIKMANWKDEQFQKVLDYCETCYGVFCFNEREKFINKIKELYDTK